MDRERAEGSAERESLAYRSGWQDGRFGETGSFASNASLAAWEDFDRLAYYRGHREGSLIRGMLRMNAGVAETA